MPSTNAPRTRHGGPHGALAVGSLATAIAVLLPLGALPATAAVVTPAAPAAAPAAATAAAPTPTLPDLDVDPADYALEARELPDGLTRALARDLGLTGAEYLAQGELTARASDLVDELESIGIVVEGTRLEEGELRVVVATAADEARVESLGLAVEVGERPSLDLDGAVIEPAAIDLYGGAPYYYTDSVGSGYRCTTGFSGIDVATRARQVITAGHCLGSEASPRRMITMTAPDQTGVLGSRIGLPVPASYRAERGWDFGLIGVDNADLAARPGVLTWGGGQSAPLSTPPLIVRDSYRLSTAGAAICKSGSTTGWTCGTVIGFAEKVPIGDPADTTPYEIDAIVACITVRKGDSGGAAVIGAAAIGVTSATGTSNEPYCGTSPSYLGFFTPLYASFPGTASSPGTEGANTFYNGTDPDYAGSWEPLMAISRPTVTSIPATTPVYTGDTLQGTVPFARTRHRVDIVIDGGATRTVGVASNGTWSVDISDLPRGTHEYSIVSRWGQLSKSAALTGRWLDARARRIAGADRYQTAVGISQSAFPSGARTVFIANGLSFPDALSAGPAAAALDAPLLLTSPASLPSSVTAELKRLKPSRIVIVGGAGVVSSSVAKQLRSYAGSVERWSGTDRYATSREIARRAFGSKGAATAYIATGASFPDALSASAAGANIGAPVILVPGKAKSVDAATATLLRSLNTVEARIAGGTGAVSSGIATSLKSVVTKVRRLAGPDRYSTSLAINVDVIDAAPAAFLTSGTNFPDALAGSVLAGLRGSPMYITPSMCVPAGVVEHIVDVDVSEIVLLGGTGVLSSNVAKLTSC